MPPGFGPFESYEAEHLVKGGERLSLAGIDIDVLFTPGHSPGHVTYALRSPAHPALLSGDVLFQGSVGRVDLPGGDWPTLERSIGSLLRAIPPRPSSTRGTWASPRSGASATRNPFLSELRERVPGARTADSPAA